MDANYSSIAGIYDRLAHFVFGKALEDSQLFLLKQIPAGSSILIVGGGTGWILEALALLHSSGLQIEYVEVSAGMMARARKRSKGDHKVCFVSCAIQDTPAETLFDVVITPFVLDNFSDPSLARVFKKIDGHLNAGGLWLFADFKQQDHKRYQKILLKLMYLFFGWFCKMEAKRLPDTDRLFHQYHYKIHSQQSSWSGFIEAIAYRKKLPDYSPQ